MVCGFRRCLVYGFYFKSYGDFIRCIVGKWGNDVSFWEIILLFGEWVVEGLILEVVIII